MVNQVYIGLDLGSTSLKVAAFDAADGRVLAQAGAPIPWERNVQGACQVPGATVRRLVPELLSQVVLGLGQRVHDVAAMSCVGHGGGLHWVDADAQLQGDYAVSSTDQRAAAYAGAVGARRHADLFAAVGCGPWAGQPTMIAQDILKQSHATDLAGHTLMFAKDYVHLLLTGKRATDYSDASTAGLLNRRTRQPDALAFEVGGWAPWSADLLAPLQAPGTLVGHVQADMARQTGLPAGLPVAMGAIDLYGAMQGAGATQTGDMTAVFGTWCVNAAMGPQDPSFEATLPAPCPGISNVVQLDAAQACMFMNNNAASMANTSWFAAVSQQNATQLMQAAFSSVPGARGLRYVPFINGGGNASAAFVGLRSLHTQADMARAVVEGALALHARSLQQLAAAGLPIRRLFALGGGAGEVRLTQLLATMMNLPIWTPGADESGARGAAMFAAQSLGQDASGMTASLRQIAPDDTHTAFYAGFLQSFDALLKNMQPVFDHTVSTQP
ncbi:MAG: FGGY family carbohydrate kinase [Rhodoferax sp.]|nr:FGGY family carbohydrate kinase [Rhodoferax sp.]